MSIGSVVDDIVAKMRGRRTPPVLAGVVLLALPTLFTVMPELAEDVPVWMRWVLLSVWLLIAILSLVAAVTRDRAIVAATAAHKLDQTRLRNNALYFLLLALSLPGGCGLPPHYEITIYIWNRRSKRLEPVHPPWPGPGPDERWFSPGDGATGKAYARNQTFVVRGEAVANNEHGLRPAQQVLWADYRSAASTPIPSDDAGTGVLGVVTALSETDDGHFEGPGGGQAALRELAETIGVLWRFVARPDALEGD